MKRYKIYTFKRLLAVAFLVGVCNGAWAQDTKNTWYTTTYNGTTVSSVNITHKAPKWTQYHEGKGYNDTYNEADMITLENGTAQVQAANAYVDTIYVHKGTSVTLTLPYRARVSDVSIQKYHRWFDYRTDGSFFCQWSHGNGTTTNNLLVPHNDDDAMKAYRFANGYVLIDGGQSALSEMDFYYPTDDEYKEISSSAYFIKSDNDYYVVACDVSIYEDFVANNDGTAATFGAANGWCEPTLAGRAIYYIIGVEDEETDRPSEFAHYWALEDSSYQGGTNTGTEHYLDEYEITYPTRRLSNNTAEMVALTKDANAYAIPGISSSDDPEELDVTLIDDANLGFNLTFAETGSTDASNAGKNGKISGSDRIIFFYKGTLGSLKIWDGTVVPTDTQWYVDNGETITILVTKTISGTTYNLARYKITFKDDANLLTQTQVAGLDKLSGNEGYWWDNLTHRSPEYMESNYSQVASLTFDYDTSVNAQTVFPESSAGKTSSYPFPMDWSFNSYAFHDGETADVQTSGPGYSMYSITNDYIGYWDNPNNNSKTTSPPTNTGKDDSSYWLYIDASERSGAVAEITIDGNLCTGSKLLGTAWIKDAGSENTTVDAGVLFSIGGVTVNSDGTETHTPILRQMTGQVRTTTFITDDVNEPGLDSSITGKGAGTNEWFQVYFSIFNDGSNNFDYYTLRVDNYCAGTNGGDYYFDDLKIYLQTPTINMTQLEPLCTSDGDAMSLLRMDIDYETMMSCFGLDPNDYIGKGTEAGTESLDLVIINSAKYYNALAAYEGSKDTDDYKTYKEEAFKAALVTFYDASGDEHQFPTLDFYLDYTQNEEYDESHPGDNIVSFNGDEADFYYRMNGSIVELSMDCYSDMMAYTKYVILVEQHTDTNKTPEEKINEFIALLDAECTIKTEFYLTSTTVLKINGETLDPIADYCTGQEFVLSPEATYTDSNGEIVYLDGVYFDWFFGSREEYEVANETFNGVSLQEALLAFRTYYPDAEELSKTETPPTGEGDAAFTQDHYDIIEYYLGQTREGGLNNMLVLHESHLSMRVLTIGLELVIQPIKVMLDDDVAEVCFGYVPLTLMVSGDAPILKAGFSNINYPDDDYQPCLRLGLAQFDKCSENTPFTINLCNATYVTEEGVDIDHLGVADGMDMLFLVDTDDPTYHNTILNKENETEIVVGKVTRLYATTENNSDPRTDTPTEAQGIGSYMQIYFFDQDDEEEGWNLTPLTVREGYYYVLSVYFQEKGAFDSDYNDEPVGNACWGTFPLEMKIVPEYLVWTGDSTCNWNNDNHWERVSATRINRTPDNDSPYFTDGNNSNTNGFVPMLFTKVIIPKNSATELYMAGFKEESDEMLSWEGDEDTANHDDVSEHPTNNIMYDMMLYETDDEQGDPVSLKTEHYRVNLCDQIHFEPGAQVLHSEQLIYNKAWTEVELPQGPWTLQATPLRGVVSGDWYTKKAGSETAEYFTDITFNTTDNNRYTPLVYQRSWGTDDSVILENYTGTTGASTSAPSYASTGWSSVYNDTSVPYQVGEGFSLSANLNSGSDNLMFRFPKADEEYTTSSSTTFERTGSGTLLISQLVDRSDPDGDNDDVYNDEQGEEREITVTLTQTGNDYYIIGNPFTAHMSMMNFMTKNEGIKGYWLESTYGPIVGTTDENGQPVNSWGTSDVLVDPYCAFFVTTDEDDISPLADTPVTVTFTKDMQKEAISTTRLEHMKALSLRATNDFGTTSAALLYDDSATDDYRLGEDAILLEDISWQHEGTPMVYTIAGDMAVGVNRVNSMPQVPLGVFADDECAYTISFVGVDCLNDPSLFDSYTNTDTALTEGYVLNMEGASHGRYFIRSNGAATEISLTENEVFDVTAYSPTPGTVIVSSTAELEDICVYSIGGMLLRQVNASGNISCTINGINSGIAIVRAKTSEGTFVKKLRVR